MLKGAPRKFFGNEACVLEVSLFELFKGVAVFYDFLIYWNKKGIVIYNVVDLRCRLLDGALAQIDIAVARRDSHLRRH